MNTPRYSCLLLTAAMLAMPTLGLGADKQEPAAVAGIIDSEVQKQLDQANMPASPLADDAEFLRRAYLDITGRIPTRDQTAAFLSNKDTDKRAKLIDELLKRPEYGMHFATVWRELMVDRTSDKSQVRQGFSWQFIDWLAKEFNEGKGWDKIVHQMVTAEGEAKKNPATTFILTNRMGTFPKPEDMVSMTGKLFMGIQLRCSQCHDHPYVKTWHQDDFWGMAAFFSQVRDHGMEGNGNSRNPKYADKPNPDEKKEKNYVNRLKRSRLIPPLDGAQISIPKLSNPAEPLRVVKAKLFLDDAPDMAENYRERLADWLTSAENPYFARAAANRLWGHFFAQGLVNPVDDMQPQRKPSHPVVLDLLEKEFQASGFDYRHVIRCICNSRAYQRTSKPMPKNAEDRELYSHMAIKILTPDQTIDSLSIAVGRTITKGKNRDRMTAYYATKEAGADATEFSHGIPQFLYQMNAGIGANSPSILGKLISGKSKEEAIEAIYLTALTRPPKAEEQKKMLAYLAQAKDVNQGYRDIYWVLLNSAEFIVNH